MKIFLVTLSIASTFCLVRSSQAQSSIGLLFREEWKEIAAALPVTQEHVSNVDLSLLLYGPARNAIKKSNHPHIPNDPFYIWSGECTGNWAVALKHRRGPIDLSSPGAKVRIRSRQSGFRQLRIILRFDDGTWCVSNQSAGPTDDWTITEFSMDALTWRKLNIDRVSEAETVKDVPLGKVSEIGFTDLMSGGGTPASSRVDWIEVWGTQAR